MKTHTLRFNAKDRSLFKEIESGQKSIETRAGSPNYIKIKQGDLVKFVCESDQIEKRVTKIEEKNGSLRLHLEDYVTIRTIEPQDAAPLQRLAKLYLEPWFGSQAKAVYDWLLGSNHRTAWVATVDSEVVGFAIVSDKPQHDYIKLSCIVVDATMRQHGVGHHLVKRCLEYAHSTQKRRLLLTVAEDNGLGKNFFEKRNFKLIGNIKNKYRPGKAELVYEYNL